MRRSWKSASVLLALLAGLTVVGPQPAQAETVADSCSGQAGPPDLAGAAFGYSATSFSVAVDLCQQPVTYGEYIVTVHLTSFSPEVQVSAGFQDLGKYLGYSGYHVCASAVCTAEYPNGFLTPAGVRIDGPCLYDVYTCPRQSTSAYGAWADVLPPSTSVPDSISWYADVRLYDRATQGWTTQADRVPDSGALTSNRNTATVATRVTSAAAPRTPVWNQYGAQRTDTGTLSTAAGSLPGRLVQIHPIRWEGARQESGSDGHWTSSYAIDRNTTVRACFAGDGVHDPSCGPAYLAAVKAFVSLNLPASSSVRRGGALQLQGVVRPAYQTGQVRVLVREDRPGTTYRLLRYTNLAQARGDSYYRISWSPTVRGRYVLRTLWTGGTTAPGGVESNISDYRRVTVT